MATQHSVIQSVRETLAGFEKLVTHYDPAAEGPTDGRFVPLEQSSLHPAVVDALRGDCPQGLFTHQFEAISHVLDGHNTVTATRTSSGKSFIYSVPVIDTLVRNLAATSLFLFPQKALANDQLYKLQTLADRIPVLAARRGYRPATHRPVRRRDRPGP